ncbi:MAG: hypothetical protein M3Q49_03750 [Actinomycetota bacterium]|nr:hypothetical protein [Actinomycetota bacterium]
MEHAESKGFERWLRKRAEKARTSPEDNEFYDRYVDAATGQDAENTAGVARHLEPGVPVPDHITNDEIYEGFVDMLSGKASRERAEEDVNQDFRDRREEARRHAREMGYPLNPQFEV